MTTSTQATSCLSSDTPTNSPFWTEPSRLLNRMAAARNNSPVSKNMAQNNCLNIESLEANSYCNKSSTPKTQSPLNTPDDSAISPTPSKKPCYHASIQTPIDHQRGASNHGRLKPGLKPGFCDRLYDKCSGIMQPVIAARGHWRE